MASDSYFTRFVPDPKQMADVHRLFLDLRETYLRAASRGDRTARLQANLVTEAYVDFQNDLLVAAARVAEEADRAIKEYIERTRVRPVHASPQHLRDLIVSEVIRTPLPAGVVGIARLDELDKAEYWKAQELGTDAHVGREVLGWFFSPGGKPSAPSPGRFRQDSAFGASSSGQPMKIAKPLRARRFLARGTDRARTVWLREMARVQRDAMRDLRTVAGKGVRGRSAHPAPPTALGQRYGLPRVR